IPYPSMITKVPSIAARISGMRSTSRIRNRSGSFMAAQSTDGGFGGLMDRARTHERWPRRKGCVQPDLCSFMSGVPHHPSGAIAATSLATPSSDHGQVRGEGSWPAESAEQAVAWEDGVITYVGPPERLPGVEPEWFEG